jgi:hypothetical protein
VTKKDGIAVHWRRELCVSHRHLRWPFPRNCVLGTDSSLSPSATGSPPIRARRRQRWRALAGLLLSPTGAAYKYPPSPPSLHTNPIQSPISPRGIDFRPDLSEGSLVLLSRYGSFRSRPSPVRFLPHRRSVVVCSDGLRSGLE